MCRSFSQLGGSFSTSGISIVSRRLSAAIQRLRAVLGPERGTRVVTEVLQGSDPNRYLDPGTLARLASEEGRETLVSTSDKDMAQLVNPHVTLVNTMSGTVMDEAGVMEKFGVRPDQIIDFLALTGDSVDNIPGVPKCGPKTAAKWLGQYGTLDGVIANADDPEVAALLPGCPGRVVTYSLRGAAADWRGTDSDAVVICPPSLRMGLVARLAKMGLAREAKRGKLAVALVDITEPANPRMAAVNAHGSSGSKVMVKRITGRAFQAAPGHGPGRPCSCRSACT